MLDAFDLPNNTVPNYKNIEAEIFSAYGDGGSHADIVLTPKGDGALVVGRFPDNSRFGGNPRGAYAIDLQSLRGAATQVASGDRSIAIGLSCTASNISSITIGSSATSIALQSLAIGSTVASRGTQSIAIGTDRTTSSGLHSIAIGDTSIASAQDACAIGVAAIASAQNAFAYGDSAVAATSASMALGLSATTARLGQFTFSNGYTFATGPKQYSMFLLQRVIANSTTATVLSINGAAPTAINSITIPVGRVMGFIAIISGAQSTGGQVMHYVRKGFIKNVAGTTSITTTPATMGTDQNDGASIQALTVTANNTLDTLAITITLNRNNETWRFAAIVHAIEFNFGT